MSSKQTKPRIFLSYSRADGEAFASELRKRLEAHGLSLWQDRTDMEGGKDWWQQIFEALDQVEYLVLVVTPVALRSPIVTKEWRVARQKGVGVIPVVGAEGLSLEGLPPWMKKAHWIDTNVPEQWMKFIRTLESPVEKIRVPFMVEDLPRDFVPRNREYEMLIEHLIRPVGDRSVAITAALRGAGGYGKTTLAKAVCHDGRIQEAFHDGVLWVTLGEQPGNLISRIEDLVLVLTGRRPGFSTIEAATMSLVELLQDRSMLLVVDDVWNSAHLKPFLQGGPGCLRLITTRISETLPAEISKFSVDAMQPDEAVALLNHGLPSGEEKALQDVAVRLGRWPVLLKLVNGLLRDRVLEKRESFSLAITYVGRALDKKGLTAFDARDPQERAQAITRTIDVSFQLLNEQERRRYAELAIFPEDIEIPLATVQKLWEATAQFDELDTQELCQRLHGLSLLLDMNLATQRIRLHDVFRTYLLHAQTNESIQRTHGAFLDGFQLSDWSKLDRRESYLWMWLSYHLKQAGRHQEMTTLLWSFNWLRAKLEVCDVGRLLEDFERTSVDGTLKLLMQTIQLSADGVRSDPEQLAGQLVGRLGASKEPEITKLLSEVICSQQERPWLRPLVPSLVGPGEALLRTLHGHSDQIMAVTMTPDGRQVVSASLDGSLKVWDLATAREVRTLRGHRGAVTAVILTPNGQQVVSGSDDRFLKVWDLATGQEVRTLSRHRGVVTAIDVTPDGQQVISGAGDRTLKQWDLVSGQEIRSMYGHGDTVKAVAVTRDGCQIVSGAGDRMVKVWSLTTGEEAFTLRGHEGGVTAVAMTPDGRQMVSGSIDGTLKIWDLTTSEEVHTLRGHRGAVTAVTVTPDGRRMISGSDDWTLKVWDLITGQEVHTFSGHGGSVTAVRVTPDGRHVVSGSGDRTLKIWALAAMQETDSPCKHEGTVTAVAVTYDGRQVLSASTDGTLKVWDLPTAQEVRALYGHRDAVTALAIVPNGRQVVSGSGDRTIKVWDRVTGHKLHTLRGHRGTVTALAVSPDGQQLVSASDDQTIKQWDLVTREEIRTLRSHRGLVTTVTVTPDGRQIVSGSSDRTIMVWDMVTGQEIHTLRGHELWVMSVVVTPDGGHAVSASVDQTIKVWDLKLGQEQRTLVRCDDMVRAMALTTGGRGVVFVSRDRLIVIGLEGGNQIASFIGDSRFECVALSPDGLTCVAGDMLGKLHFLRLEGVS